MTNIDFQPESTENQIDFQPESQSMVAPSSGQSFLSGLASHVGAMAKALTGQTLSPNTLSRIVSDIDIGATRMGLGARSAPHFIAQTLAKHGVISPETAAKFTLPSIAFSSQGLTTPLQGKQIEQAYGVTKPTTADVLLQGAAQYLPYTAIGGASIPGQMAAGALYGATQTKEPGLGAITGGITGLGAGAAGKAAELSLPLIKNILSKYAAPGISKTIEGGLDNIKNVNSANAFKMAKNNFNKYQDIENEAWDNLNNQAALTDMNPKVKFDDDDYVSALQNKLQDLKKEAKQSGLARKNEDSISLLQDYISDPHKSFTQAIAHNRGLNADFQNEITPGKSLPFSMVNYAKSNLKNSVKQNLEDNNLKDNLGLSWQAANQATKNKNSIFNEIVSPAGKPQPSTFMKYYRGDPQYGDPSNFVKQYLPQAKAEGAQKMKQFSQMVGDENYAKNVLKANYFDKSYDDTGFKPESFLKKYNDLSQEQRDYLFPKDQQDTINGLNKIISKYPDALRKLHFYSLGSYHTLPFLAGAGLGEYFGHQGLLGGISGVAGTKLLEGALKRILARPSLQRAVLSGLNEQQGINPIRSVLANLLKPKSVSAATVPFATSQTAGGQS